MAAHGATEQDHIYIAHAPAKLLHSDKSCVLLYVVKQRYYYPLEAETVLQQKKCVNGVHNSFNGIRTACARCGAVRLVQNGVSSSHSPVSPRPRRPTVLDHSHVRTVPNTGCNGASHALVCHGDNAPAS